MSGRTPSPKLPPAPGAYSQRDQQELRNELERRDEQNHKRDGHLEVRSGAYIILTDTDGTGARYSITVASGVLTLTAL